MPTALATPWPSGPVVVSTPVVWPYSGWPGVFELPGAERLQVVQLQAVTGEVELDVEGQAGVARGEDEPVAAGPVRVRRVVPHQLLEEKVGGRRQAHGRTRMAVTDLLHGIHGQDTDGVHCPLIQFGPLEICGGRLGAHPESGLLSTCRMPRTVCPPGGVEPTPARACVFSTLSRRFPALSRCGAGHGVSPLRAPTSGLRAFPVPRCRPYDQTAGRRPPSPPERRADARVEDAVTTPRPGAQHDPTPAKIAVWPTSKVAWYAQALHRVFTAGRACRPYLFCGKGRRCYFQGCA